MKVQINSIDSIRKYAKLQGLNYLEITESYNGYPEPLTGFGITGFSDFADCQQFADKYEGGIISLFTQRFGWDLWNEDGIRFNEFTLLEQAEMFENVVFDAEQLEDTDRFDNESLSTEVRSEILKYLNMGLAVVLTWYNDEYHVRTTLEAGMSYQYDSKRYEIGVYFSFSDFDSE